MKEVISKWDLAHWQELLENYTNFNNECKIRNNGSIICYRIRPKWWATLLREIDEITFLEAVKNVFTTMTGGKEDDIGFASTFLKADRKELIDVLYMLHVYAKNKIDSPSKTKIYTEAQKRNIDVSTENPESVIIDTMDGPYRVTTIPIYFKQKFGIDLSVDELVERIRTHFEKS